MAAVSQLSRARVRALQGFVLALGAPLGWMAIQAASGTDPIADLAAAPGVYVYMLVGTTIVLTAFGYYVGTEEQAYQYHALHDPLTGLGNVAHFWQRLRDAHALATRRGTLLTVAILDLDHFKHVNDSCGHPVGDALLAAVGHALLKATRAGETVARVGGEEFAVIMPGATPQEACAGAERLRDAINNVRIVKRADITISVTASAGVATFSAVNRFEPEALYQAADKAMYAAKQQGRNRTVAMTRLDASASFDERQHQGSPTESHLRGSTVQAGEESGPGMV
jgi:diguanylate cyclase (GGDEF)-like protein